MFNVIFEGEIYNVINITNSYYVCLSKTKKGRFYIRKEGAEVA